MLTVTSPVARPRRAWRDAPLELLVDIVMAVISGALLLLVGFYQFGDADGVQVVVVAVCAAGLSVRRVWPGPSLIAVFLSLAVGVLAVGQARPVDALVLVSLYSACGWAGARWQVAAISCGVVGSLVAATLPPQLPLPTAAAAALATAGFYLVLVVAACALGFLTRARGELTAQLRLRAESAEAEQVRQAELIAAQERARVARDVHDVVAHSLTVIAVQAQAGSYAAATQAGAATASLDAIAATAKSALRDVRNVLHLLRAPERSDSARTLVGIDELIDQTRALGLTIAFEEVGQPRAAGAVFDDAVFRLIQEALTNTMRHADPAASAVVHLDWTHNALGILIENDEHLTRPAHPVSATTQVAPRGSGLGLAGMRERVHALGGSVETGPTTQGFRVRAELPYPSGVT